jgi:hypothetical protein
VNADRRRGGAKEAGRSSNANRDLNTNASIVTADGAIGSAVNGAATFGPSAGLFAGATAMCWISVSRLAR